MSRGDELRVAIASLPQNVTACVISVFGENGWHPPLSLREYIPPTVSLTNLLENLALKLFSSKDAEKSLPKSTNSKKKKSNANAKKKSNARLKNRGKIHRSSSRDLDTLWNEVSSLWGAGLLRETAECLNEIILTSDNNEGNSWKDILFDARATLSELLVACNFPQVAIRLCKEAFFERYSAGIKASDVKIALERCQRLSVLLIRKCGGLSEAQSIIELAGKEAGRHIHRKNMCELYILLSECKMEEGEPWQICDTLCGICKFSDKSEYGSGYENILAAALLVSVMLDDIARYKNLEKLLLSALNSSRKVLDSNNSSEMFERFIKYSNHFMYKSEVEDKYVALNEDWDKCIYGGILKSLFLNI